MRKFIYSIAAFMVCAIAAKAQITGQVNVNLTDVQISAQGDYSKIRLEGADELMRQVGAPELPVIVKTFVIPADAKVTGVDVAVNSRTALDGTFQPYPAQPPVTVGDNAPDFVPPADSIYNGSSPYPSTRAEIVADYNQMGYHLVAVRLYPIEFEPESKKIYINSFGFTLRYQQGAQQAKRPQAQSERRTRLIKKMIAAMVANPQDIERFSDTYQKQTTPMVKAASNAVHLPSLEKILSEQIPDYIIITNEELRPEFSRLANWKIQKGVPTIIKDIAEIREEYIGSDLPEKIHAYL